MNTNSTAAAKRPSRIWPILREWMVVVLFVAGLALIAAGLWCIWPPLALIFGGIALLYLAMCVSKVAKFPVKDG